MIKLIIENKLENKLYEYVWRFPDEITTNEMVKFRIRTIEPYDEEKWKNGKIYEFNTLKEVSEFIDSCDIGFTDEYADTFSEWDWEEIDINYIIDESEDNLIKLSINSHREWRD